MRFSGLRPMQEEIALDPHRWGQIRMRVKKIETENGRSGGMEERSFHQHAPLGPNS